MANPDHLDVALKVGAPFATYFFGRWLKAWEIAGSDLKDRADEICKLIDKIADDAWKYWNRGGADAADQEVERRQIADFEHLEALRAYCEEEGPAFGTEALIDDTDRLYTRVTGGDFRSNPRAADTMNADNIRKEASALAMKFRQARRSERQRLLPSWLIRIWRRICRWLTNLISSADPWQEK